MQTLRLTVDPAHADSDASRAAIRRAAAILAQGGLVAFPTETVYGLGANALDPNAVEKIFLAKQRPTWDPLIVHISGHAMLLAVVACGPLDLHPPMSASAAALIAAFWPGPLTLLLPRAAAVPPAVTAGRPLVGVRMPAHPIARALIAAAGVPIAAPSANSFGRISPTIAAHVLEDLDGRIDAVLDGGETTHGLESTVVDASREPVIVYRPGIISFHQVREVCPTAQLWQPPATPAQAENETPASMPSPGLGIRHYAPRARLLLIAGDPASQAAAIVAAVRDAGLPPDRIGIMLPSNLSPDSLAALNDQAVIFDWGSWNNPSELAHRLFAGLRALDSAGVELILCPLPPPEGVGAAIRDRLERAARAR